MSHRATCSGPADGPRELARAIAPRPARGRAVRCQGGSALVAVLLVLSLGLVTTGVLVLLSSSEVRLAASDREAVEARYAAEAAFDRAMVDLRATASWSDVLAGWVSSSFAVGPALLPTASGTIDLEVERERMQSLTDATSAAAANAPRWRLFGWGPLDSVLPAVVDSRSPLSVAVWVADDEAEADGMPETDSNQSVWVRAVAYGGWGGRHAIEGLVLRAAPGGPLRRVIWREASGP